MVIIIYKYAGFVKLDTLFLLDTELSKPQMNYVYINIIYMNFLDKNSLEQGRIFTLENKDATKQSLERFSHNREKYKKV